MKQGQKNWEYIHTESAWPIVNAFLPTDKELNDTALLKQKLQEIQNVECNNHLRGGIVNIYNAYDTSWMIAMMRMGYKYAVVWFEGVWPANDGFNLELLDEIDRYNDEDTEWMLAGQIDTTIPGVYPFISRSFVIINFAKWHQYREPSPFYEPAHHPGWINYNSDLNWEDSEYKIEKDPMWQFGDEPPSRFINQHCFAATWIQFSFSRGVSVWGISDTLMQSITQTKPGYGKHEFEKGLGGKPYDKERVSTQANRLITNTFAPTSPIYFVNTEPSSPNVSPQLFDSSFAQYVGATAGFKLLYYAKKYGFRRKDATFVWFDFDADSVRFKQETVQQWDGVDYIKWVDDWCERNPQANQRLRELTHERWPIVVDQFGGATEWQEFWKDVQECNHKFIQADLINGHDKLFDELDNVRTFMWASNIYSYIVPKLLAEPFALETSFISMITKLKQKHNDSWYSGTDVNDADLMCPARVITSATDNSSIGLE